MTVSDGVGAGVVVNGEVIRGHNNSAGEFGHVPIDPLGPMCLCGARGCLEIAVDAVLYEAKLPLRQLMRLDIGDTLPLEIRPDALVTVRCGDVTLTEGRMGRVGDRVAVRVAKPLRKPRTTLAMFEGTEGAANRMEGS